MLPYNRTLSMAECLPERFDFLDEYQSHSFAQIRWDDNDAAGITIRGKAPKQYMYDGLHEELTELLNEEDRVEPYNRLKVLLSPVLAAETVSSTAVARHVKEFGDVSWYLANFLKLYDISFAHVAQVGEQAWTLDVESSPRANVAFHTEIERRFPFVKLYGYAHELTSVADRILPKRQDDRVIEEQRLVVAAGKFTLSMIHVVTTQFDTTYQEVLEGNKAKLARRIKDGTIFEKSGGDDR